MTPRGSGYASPARAGALRVPPALMRPAVRQLGRSVLNPGLPWETQRRRLEAVMRHSLRPRGTAVTESVVNGVRAEVVMPAGTSPARTVIHFHGGGYCVGSPSMARTWAVHLSAEAACRVVVPEYRLAPEHPHPAALDDAQAVLSALLSEVGPGSTVVSGDSAGAGLALAASLALRGRGERLPAGCVLVSPWLDLSTDRRAVPELVRRDVLLSPGWLGACAIAYADPSAWADPSVSPLFSELSGLPPLLVQSGSHELVGPDAERLATWASAAGVDVTYTRWPGMWHNFALQPGLLAAANSAVSQAAWFVDTVTGHG